MKSRAARMGEQGVDEGVTTGSEAVDEGPGRRRGFIAALGVGQIVSWGSLYYSFPLLAPPMARSLGLTQPQVYGAATLGLVVAGLAAYPVGTAIDRGRGRQVMTVGSLLAGALLLAWSRVEGLAALYLLFVGMGLAQAMTLYEPAFAVVARRYGASARSGITALTLWGGFASTVFVPLVQVLLDASGWRMALVFLGVCNLTVSVGLHGWVIDPARDVPPSAPREAGSRDSAGGPVLRMVVCRPAFWGLAIAFTVYYGVFSGITYHLYPLLLERGIDALDVVWVIALIGPAQVAGRMALWAFAASRSIRLIGVATVAVFPVAFLLLALPAGYAALVVFALMYGAANGVMTIIRGLAVPEMLTRQAYGAVNGVLAAPSFAAKAVAPVLAAMLYAAAGGYHSVVVAALIGSLIVAASFVFAAITSAGG